MSAFSLRSVGNVVRRLLWIVVPVALVLLVAWIKLWKPARVQVVRLDQGPVVQESLGRGTVESQREVAVGFDLVGRLSNVMVDEGVRVTLGQELAQLETTQAQADLSSAQSSVAAARSALLRIAADEERARTAQAAAVREAARNQTLFDSGALASQLLDEANDRVRLANADLDRVLAQRSEATRGIAVASGGAEQRRAAMVRTTLLAPFDGLVTRRFREPGDTVSIGTTVLRIVDTNRVYVNAAMDETILAQLKIDQPALIYFPGSPTPIAAKVSKIAWESDRQTHELQVEVTPATLDRRIAIGQRADVRIELGRRDQAVRLPVKMLHLDATGPFVYVDRGGRIAMVRPTLGLAGATYVEVLSGLAAGDAVLSAASPTSTLPVGRKWQAL
ncbi:MAG: efflux RND transporter periplasmic adaptor subunit [Kofleriaceae bacterium]|nr:efflux RND transporter periplasmic adaptor subunit [Kofleriaceae bacterium]